ncbi:MAG: TetR/AcrR family transcriptional regulator [Ruminococcaceae bacterium]|nr:TetR/AcrR family transcriptional regulator [Oscillospiraceae bacterium]
MKTREDKRAALIESAIKLIGEHGLDKATIPAVCKNANLNEVYVHRLFGGRTDLYNAVFDVLDREFSDFLVKASSRDFPDDEDLRKKVFREIFDELWDFSIENSTRSMAFIRLFYSRYFNKEHLQNRRKLYAPVNRRIEEYVGGNIDGAETLNRFLDFHFCSILRALRDESEDKDYLANQTFDLIVMYARYVKNF